LASQQTIKRLSTFIDAANALFFLISDDSAFITGQILHVDGGFSRSGACDLTGLYERENFNLQTDSKMRTTIYLATACGLAVI
jgi:Enoyl-(Acyl carrier protein) reductase